MLYKTIFHILIAMATGSAGDSWMFSTNATSAHYRMITVHLDKGPPLLVGNSDDVSRVVLGGDPHHKETNQGDDFSVTLDPHQTNELSVNILAFETVRLAKVPDQLADVPTVTRRMFLTKDQPWRDFACDDHTRLQCDLPPSSSIGWISITAFDRTTPCRYNVGADQTTSLGEYFVKQGATNLD